VRHPTSKSHKYLLQNLLNCACHSVVKLPLKFQCSHFHPDHRQKLISCCLSYIPPSKNFIKIRPRLFELPRGQTGRPADRQADGQSELRKSTRRAQTSAKAADPENTKYSWPYPVVRINSSIEHFVTSETYYPPKNSQTFVDEFSSYQEKISRRSHKYFCEVANRQTRRMKHTSFAEIINCDFSQTSGISARRRFQRGAMTAA